MATRSWVGGADGQPHLGRYKVAADWGAGVASVAGCTAEIRGVAFTGITKIGEAISFPLDRG